MMSAWTRRFLLGCCLVWPVACVVSVGDDGDIDDGLAGASGGTSRAGSSGASGVSGSGGNAGDAGNAGSAGSGEGGAGGSDSIPTPVCSAEDDDDECLTCIKQQCCVEWQGCDTITCQEQREDLVLCVDGSGDAELYNDVCIPMAAGDEDFLASNTQALMLCVNQRITGDAGFDITRCGIECFGDHLLMDD